MKNPSDILKDLLEETGENYNSLSKKMGMDRPQNLYDIRDGKVKSLSVGIISGMKKAYPNINEQYLMTGEGDLFIKDNEYKKIKPNAKPVLFKGNGMPNMWIVPIKAQGGFLEGYGDNVLLEQHLEKVYFPFIGTECFAFEIDGLSMVTEYMPGEYFVGTPIEQFNYMVKGRVYVFQTIDGIILKEFVRVEGDYIHLRSQNEDYNPVKPIYLKEVKRVYQREMIIKN